MNGPERTCVGCRQRGPKPELLRLVQAPPEPDGSHSRPSAVPRVLVDVTQSEPGRGAYLHRRPGCLQLALRRRALGRALRSSSPDGEQVLRAVQPHLDGAIGTA